MIEADAFVAALRRAGVGLFSGTPCSYLTPLEPGYVLAFRGTDTNNFKAFATDMLANAKQLFEFKGAQYTQAIEIANALSVPLKGRLVVAGHSLGGGLASAAAIVGDFSADTFNASGVVEVAFIASCFPCRC